MDPIQVLASQKFERQNTVHSQAEIEAFYKEHGHDWFARVCRWSKALRAFLSAAWSNRPAFLAFATPRRKV